LPLDALTPKFTKLYGSHLVVRVLYKISQNATAYLSMVLPHSLSHVTRSINKYYIFFFRTNKHRSLLRDTRTRQNAERGGSARRIAIGQF